MNVKEGRKGKERERNGQGKRREWGLNVGVLTLGLNVGA
jgi:hypothetical protein